MSCISDSTPLIAGSAVSSKWPGHGIRGDAISASGTNAGSPVFNDLNLPADAAKEYRFVMEQLPTQGTLLYDEDCNVDYIAPPGTLNLQDSYVYRLYEDGVDLGTATETIVIGTPTGGTLTVQAALSETVAALVSATVVVSQGVLADAVISQAVDCAIAASVDIVAPPPAELLVSAAITETVLSALDATVSIGSGLEPVPPMGPGLRHIEAGRLAPRRLLDLDVGEVDNLSADMSPVLTLEDPIVDVNITCEERVGDDPSTARRLLYGDWQVNGLMVRQRIRGDLGAEGVTYLLRVEAVSQSGRVAVAAGFVKVVRIA